MFLKKDNFKLGLVLGLIAPFFGMLIHYLVKFYPTFSLGDYFGSMTSNKSLLSAMITISLVANIFIFTLYSNAHIDKTARGIFACTAVYILVALYIKFFV
ncbi:hypothetical protein DXN05_07410 [Deminuibacter soli]|uniref:Stationary phase survival protein SurE n=2 Tax=Deminuibacter soli TaxID=2291815 RepID=A0A3E1NL05_9BACT|nr:hypothetical protein DXN05_07410 [Deminuibacter soli]